MRNHLGSWAQPRLMAMLAFGIICLGAAESISQPLPWNPPCVNATVINNTGCQATLNLWTTPPGAIPIINVPPCGRIVVPTIPAPITINGVFSQALAAVPMVRPGPVPPAVLPPCPPLVPAPGAADGWVRGVTLPPTGCCFDVYFYVNADPNYRCTIMLFPGTPPCTP